MDYFDNQDFPKAKRALLTVSTIVLLLSVITTEEYVIKTPAVKLIFTNEERLMSILIVILVYQIINFILRYFQKTRKDRYDNSIMFQEKIKETGFANDHQEELETANKNLHWMEEDLRKLFEKYDQELPEKNNELKSKIEELPFNTEEQLDKAIWMYNEFVKSNNEVSIATQLVKEFNLMGKSEKESKWLDFRVTLIYSVGVLFWAIFCLIVFE